MSWKKIMLIALLIMGLLVFVACDDDSDVDPNDNIIDDEEEDIIDDEEEGEDEEGEDEEGDNGNGMYTDGTYTGTAEGYGGEIELEVTIEDGEISGIEVLSQEETEDLGDDAIDDIIEQVEEQNGTEDVEVVSGATASSDATIEAIEAALDEARAE